MTTKAPNKKSQRRKYVCDICGAVSDRQEECCGQPMTKV